MKQPLRWLLIFMSLCLSLSLLACGKGDGEEYDSESDTVAQSDAAEEETPPVEDAAAQLLRYFILDPEESELALAKATQYEGEVVDVDGKNHLLAIRTRDLDAENQVVDTVSVYHMKSGELLRREQVKNPLGEAEKTELSLEIDYPILRVIRKDLRDDSYEIAHYLAKKDGALLHTTSRYIPAEDHPKTVYGNGLVSYNMGDVILWIDRNMETVRSVDAIAAGGYELQRYNSEYQGYLYTWNEQTLQIFNRLGVLSGSYTISHKGELNVHVLDNGNVLIQDLWEVDEHTSSTLTLENTKYRLTSYVMSYLDGSLTEVSLDFLVDSLETAYAQRYGETGGRRLPFRLAAGYDNQAILYRFANGRLSVYQEYAVLGNDLRVLYSVKNTTDGVNLKEARPIGGALYAAPVSEGGATHDYIFDAEGNVVTAMGRMSLVMNERIVTENGIYTHRMERLLDLGAEPYANSLFGVDPSADRVYLKVYSFARGCFESFVYDPASELPRLLTDGVGEDLYTVGDGYYVIHLLGTNEYRSCKRDGEAVLTVYGEPQVLRCEEALLVGTAFEGKPITYVLA
jgi:hypothetical protein